MTERTLYRDYLLSCQPVQQVDGRYQGRVVIMSMAGHQTRSQRFLDLPEAFDTEKDAVECARQSGMAWVDVNQTRS